MEPPGKHLTMLPSGRQQVLQVTVRMKMQVERAEGMAESQRWCVEWVWQQAAGVELVELGQVVGEELGSLSRSRWPAEDWPG